MAIEIWVDFKRGVRLVEFSGSVTPEHLGLVGEMYYDRKFYDFSHAELVVFTPDATLMSVSALDLGDLADSYNAALAEREDAGPTVSAWVINEHVATEARMWKQFSRQDSLLEKQRHYADDVEGALEKLGLPAALADDVRAKRGFKAFAGRERV
ncbi:hypothetical protein [Maricaulis sp. CAU 1757]